MDGVLILQVQGPGLNQLQQLMTIINDTYMHKVVILLNWRAMCTRSCVLVLVVWSVTVMLVIVFIPCISSCEAPPMGL